MSSAAKVAIITGAGRGIGQATAAELSRRGWAIVVVSRTEADLDALVASLGQAALSVTADITDGAALERVVQATTDRFGRLDAVVNNAGLAPMMPFDETDDATFRRVVDVNLTAAFTLSRLAWPHLKSAGGGTIVNLSSLSAIDPFPGLSAYAAAKAGLEGLTVALAKEGAEHGICCMAVSPGAVETEMFRALPGMAEVPAEALLLPEEVANVIADCITGPLHYASGETIRLRKSRG